MSVLFWEGFAYYKGKCCMGDNWLRMTLCEFSALHKGYSLTEKIPYE